MARGYRNDGDVRPVMLDGGVRRLIEELVRGRLRWGGFVETEHEALQRARAALRVGRRPLPLRQKPHASRRK
jgi:hypothetical protein